MKVLLIGPVPPHLGSKNPGGIAHHLWSLATNLKEQGHEVAILAIGRYYESTRGKDGILIYGMEKKFLPFIKSLFLAPGLLARIGITPSKKTYIHALYSLFRINTIEHLDRYDVIHLHGIHNTALYALEISGIDTPRIVTVHSYHDLLTLEKNKQDKRIIFINKYLRSADCLIHVSKADKMKGKELGVAFKGINEVIHNGLEVGYGVSHSERISICFVGMLIPRKRISLSLQSAQYVDSGIKKIHIAGDGPLRNEVELAAVENPLISYHGVLPNEEVRKIMRDSSLLFVPSLSESFGLVYVEALFEGAAVMGYGPTIEEFQEVMELTEIEKKLVVPIPPDDIDPQILAKKIDATFEFRQSEKGKETMQRVRQRAIDNFSWSSIIHKMEKTYEKVVSSRKL